MNEPLAEDINKILQSHKNQYLGLLLCKFHINNFICLWVTAFWNLGVQIEFSVLVRSEKFQRVFWTFASEKIPYFERVPLTKTHGHQLCVQIYHLSPSFNESEKFFVHSGLLKSGLFMYKVYIFFALGCQIYFQ